MAASYRTASANRQPRNATLGAFANGRFAVSIAAIKTARCGLEQTGVPYMSTNHAMEPVMKMIAVCLLVASLVVAGGSALVPSAAAQDAGQAASLPSPATAPVVIDGRFLFRLRGVSAYSAEDRAEEVTRRIVAVARDDTIAPEAIAVETLADRSNLRAGNMLIVSLFDVDAELEGIERPLLAEAVRQQVGETIERYRRDRSTGQLATDAAYAVGATLVFALAIALLLGFARSFNRYAAARHQKYTAPIEARSSRLVRADQIWRLLHALLWGLWVLVAVVLSYVYLVFLLSLFPWTRAFSTRLSDLMSERLQTVGVAILEAVPDLILVLIVIVITRYALKMTRLFFDAIKQGNVMIGRFLPEWADPTYRIVRVVVVAFAFVVAYPYLPGSGTAAFHGVSIFLGVLLSLGSSSLISNAIAGHTLTYRRAFHIGDMVKVQDTLGEVTEVGLLVTRLRTPKNESVVVPNSLILGNQLLNYSELARTHGVALHTTVGLGYEVPWRQAEEMLLMAAGRTTGVASEPAPFVHQTALGDFSVVYELNVYCRDAQAMIPIRSALHRSILDVFNEFGVQIMTPAYENDPETAKTVPRDRWFAAPARPDDGGPTADSAAVAKPG
jgi:small-conductance mechanosensitive channel